MKKQNIDWHCQQTFENKKVCWHHPAMFCLITSSKLSCQKFEFFLKVKVMGSNPGYLLKSFLLCRLSRKGAVSLKRAHRNTLFENFGCEPELTSMHSRLREGGYARLLSVNCTGCMKNCTYFRPFHVQFYPEVIISKCG